MSLTHKTKYEVNIATKTKFLKVIRPATVIPLTSPFQYVIILLISKRQVNSTEIYSTHYAYMLLYLS